MYLVGKDSLFLPPPFSPHRNTVLTSNGTVKFNLESNMSDYGLGTHLLPSIPYGSRFMKLFKIIEQGKY